MHKVRDIEIMEKLGNSLREARKRLGISQEELSHRSGLTLSQIARIETAKINASISTVYVLANAMGMKVSELVDF